jgi:hypothetical protein
MYPLFSDLRTGRNGEHAKRFFVSTQSRQHGQNQLLGIPAGCQNANNGATHNDTQLEMGNIFSKCMTLEHISNP